jgi:hypothetical protein
MGKIDQSRHLAASCTRLAQQADNPPEKSALLRMAASWQRLVEHAEHPESADSGEDDRSTH